MLGKLCGEPILINLFLVMLRDGLVVAHMLLYSVIVQDVVLLVIITLVLAKMPTLKTLHLQVTIISALVKMQPTTTKVVEM